MKLYFGGSSGSTFGEQTILLRFECCTVDRLW